MSRLSGGNWNWWCVVLAAAASLSSEAALGQGRPASADSVAAADGARRECGAGRESSLACYEKLLERMAGSGDVRLPMATLSLLASRDAFILFQSHRLAHTIGIAAGRSSPDTRRTFASCTEQFQSGCYHGVLQAHFQKANRLDSAEVNGLCADARDGSRFLLYQCVHGLGHGLMMFHDHDLVAGLRSCDLLADHWERETCLGGAMMEAVVTAVDPHHAGPDAASHDAHAHHGAAAGGGAGAVKQPLIRPDDHHYPCSALEERYLYACYMMQTTIMLHLNRDDVARTARDCAGAPVAMREVCFTALGREIAGRAVGRPSTAVELCSRTGGAAEPACLAGAVKVMVNQRGQVSDGMELCRAAKTAASKESCYVAVGELIADIEPTPESRARACDGAEREYGAACRKGARME